MPGLCPRCGEECCKHTVIERGQTEEEYQEDLIRELTEEERKALASGKKSDKIGSAVWLLLLRRQEKSFPKFSKKK
jgi:hypothetical protein